MFGFMLLKMAAFVVVTAVAEETGVLRMVRNDVRELLDDV